MLPRTLPLTMKTRSFALLAMLMCPLATSTAGDLRLEYDLPPNSFLALRFQVLDDTDIEVDFRSYTCHDEEGTDPQAFGERLILDGRLSLGSHGPGGTSSGTTLEKRLVEAGAQGNAFSAPYLWPDVWNNEVVREVVASSGGGGCWRLTYGIGPWLRGGNVATQVLWTTATSTKLFANATWSRGFVSYDVASGPIHALKPHQFEQGATIGVTPPIVGGASMGALLSEHITTQHDTIGDWWPYLGSHPGGDSYCYQNSAPCPDPDPNYFFRSEGPTEWEWGFTLRPELSTPAYPLIAIELPDDSYLYD